MAYIWQQPLAAIAEVPLPESIQQYYQQLQQQAQQLVTTMNGQNLKEQLPKLNGIEERCSLLFHFLEHPEIPVFTTAEELIAYVDQAYAQTYLERLEVLDTEAAAASSLLYAVDQVSQLEWGPFLWELDVCGLLAKHFNQTVEATRKQLENLLSYYEGLQRLGTTYLAALTESNFSVVYPKLLAVDAKCRLLLVTYPYLLATPWDQYSLIELVEKEYVPAHQELFGEDVSWYDKQLLGYTIAAGV